MATSSGYYKGKLVVAEFSNGQLMFARALQGGGKYQALALRARAMTPELALAYQRGGKPPLEHVVLLPRVEEIPQAKIRPGEVTVYYQWATVDALKPEREKELAGSVLCRAMAMEAGSFKVFSNQRDLARSKLSRAVAAEGEIKLEIFENGDPTPQATPLHSSVGWVFGRPAEVPVEAAGGEEDVLAQWDEAAVKWDKECADAEAALARTLARVKEEKMARRKGLDDFLENESRKMARITDDMERARKEVERAEKELALWSAKHEKVLAGIESSKRRIRELSNSD